MHRLLAVGFTWLLVAAPVGAQAKRDIRAEDVKESIAKGVKYLRQIQFANGSWEIDDPSQLKITMSNPGGKTALTLLALLTAGQDAKDPTVALGLTYLRKIPPDKTYLTALQLLTFAEAGQVEDRQRMSHCVKRLLDGRVYRGTEFIGWGYPLKPNGSSDNSNTQYAVLGLWVARQAGIDVPDAVFKQIRDYYTAYQSPAGSWSYRTPGRAMEIPIDGRTATMTTAGLCGLLIAGMELNVRRETLQLDGTATNCGKYDDNPPVQKALGWVGTNFTPQIEHGTFYHLYGLERAGRLSGLRYFGNHDWYREGCQFLVNAQRGDGSWSIAGAGFDNWPEVSTSFALLFLSKGRTPVLISKLVHGPWPREPRDPKLMDADESRLRNDWNNDRNDLRHLTEYVSKQMFKVPLAWQAMDLSRGLQAQARGLNFSEDDFQAVTSDMLQSPILYITGHRSPLRRLRAEEKALLKRYVENGGFILAEACCGNPEFDEGLKELVAELWPGGSFDRLPVDHPVYTAYAPVKPGQPYTIWGLQQGCKTVLVYSPQDLSCRWETGRPDDPNCIQAFRLGANIIAYATGMEPPQPRLTKIDVAGNRNDPSRPQRGYIQIAQLKVPGEAAPAPRAMRNLLEHTQKYAGIDVNLDTKHLFIDNNAIVNFKFIYMHGRKGFNFEPTDLKDLRFNLQTGGLLFADACCGKEAFDQSFRKFIGELLPKTKLEQVPLNDELFSAELNGEALTEANIDCRTTAGGPMRRTAPFLEGVKHQGRWVVLYSKYDIGCALERHQSSDCRGYNPASAQKIARAALLYTLRP